MPFIILKNGAHVCSSMFQKSSLRDSRLQRITYSTRNVGSAEMSMYVLPVDIVIEISYGFVGVIK